MNTWRAKPERVTLVDERVERAEIGVALTAGVLGFASTTHAWVQQPRFHPSQRRLGAKCWHTGGRERKFGGGLSGGAARRGLQGANGGRRGAAVTMEPIGQLWVNGGRIAALLRASVLPAAIVNAAKRLPACS
jgi:hypothetical protein